MSIQLFPRMLRRRSLVDSSEYPGDEFFATLQGRAVLPDGLPNFDQLETLDERMADTPPPGALRPTLGEPDVPRPARFTLRLPLGEDMLGQLYEAWDSTLGRTVAVKTVQLHMNNPARALLDNLFLQEAQAAARLNHPHIVKVHHVGLSAHGVYIAMERLHGGDLQRALDEGWRPTTAQSVLLGRRVADALAYAHARGVLHCNIKPANVFVLPDGRPKVMNFGMARAAHGTNIPELDGLALGSPHYLSPEQLQGAEVDARTDIHALGVMLYELLTGSRAFPGHTVSQIAAALLHHRPVPAQTAQPGLPPGLAAIVARAMARHPAERYQKASEMALALRSWGDSVEAGSSRAKQRKSTRDDDALIDKLDKLEVSEPAPITAAAPVSPAAEPPVNASVGSVAEHDAGHGGHGHHSAHSHGTPTGVGVGFVVSQDGSKSSARGKKSTKHGKHSFHEPVPSTAVELHPPPHKRPGLGRLSVQLLVGVLVLAALASAGLSLREQARARQAVPEVVVAPELTPFPTTVAAPAPDAVVQIVPEVAAVLPVAEGASAAMGQTGTQEQPPSLPPSLPPALPPEVTLAPALPPVLKEASKPARAELPKVAPKELLKPPPVPRLETPQPAAKPVAKVVAPVVTAAVVSEPGTARAAVPRKVEGAREAARDAPQTTGPADRKTSTALPVPAAAVAAPSAPAVRETPRAEPSPQRAAVVTGTVRLAISPWGQIDVDGAPAGTSPPLTRLNLSEGKHVITVRNDDAPPYSVTVHVTADEPVTVRHRFGP